MKMYGIRFIYIGNQSTKIFWQNEEERNDIFTTIANSNWNGICIINGTIVNLKNVIFCEKIER